MSMSRAAEAVRVKELRVTSRHDGLVRQGRVGTFFVPTRE